MRALSSLFLRGQGGSGQAVADDVFPVEFETHAGCLRDGDAALLVARDEGLPSN